MQGRFELKSLSLNIELFISLGRGDRISEINFALLPVSESPRIETTQKLQASVEKLASALVGIDLVKLRSLDTKEWDIYSQELLHFIDELNWSYRHGQVPRVDNFVLCPCHSVGHQELAQAIREAPELSFREIQAKTGIAVTCDSCFNLCQNFSAHLKATEALVGNTPLDELRIYGQTQAELALRLQKYLDTHFPGVLVKSLNGHELSLSESENFIEIFESLQSAFEVRFTSRPLKI